MSTTLLAVLLLANACNRESCGFVLAEREAPADCEIVLPIKETEVQKYAAAELQSFVEKLTGVRLPVREGGARRLKRAVILSDGEQKQWKDDGFRLLVRGDELRIEADPTRGGTLYGVYEILERFGGCRWYASWCERIPARKVLAVPEDLDERHVPAFEMRQLFWYDALQHHDFAARLRMNSHQWRGMEEKYGGEHFRFGGGLVNCHTFETLVPAARYGKTHPEYFALHDGKRRNVLTDVEQRCVQLCLTNPDVLELVVSNVLARIRKDPGAGFYGVSQNDNELYCECEKCAAVDEEEGSHAGTIVRFVNAVAERVEREFPDVTIETLAYKYSRHPPGKTRLRKNVVPCLCSIECDLARPLPESPCAQSRDFCADIRGWRTMTDRLYVWDYATDFTHYVLPFANVLTLQGNLRFFRKNGVRYLFDQGAYSGRHGDFAELKTWLLSKWMWNPDLPVEPLLNDFFSGYYGKAAPIVREYFDELHRRQKNWSEDPKNPLHVYCDTDLGALTDEFLSWAAQRFSAATAAVEDDPLRSYNVRMAAIAVDYVRLERLIRGGCPVLSFVGSLEQAPEVRLQRELATRLLSRLDEVKDLRFCENEKEHERHLETWRKLVEWVPQLSERGRGTVEEASFELRWRRRWCDLVEDPAAEDGKAVKMFGTHCHWCVTLPMGKVRFRSGKRYTLRARIRATSRPGAKGEVFRCGVYDPVGKRDCGAGRCVMVAELKPGYHWYDVTTWEPQTADYLWFAPGAFRRERGETSSAEDIWIDKIELIENDVPEGRIGDCGYSTELNRAAREQASVPVRAGVPGRVPFWNAKARAFIHPPAFDFKEIAGATAYRFTLTNEQGVATSWQAAKPWLPMDGAAWNSQKPGYLTLKVEGVGADGAVRGVVGERTFYRAAVFHGPYPDRATDYRTAARRVYASVFNLPQVQGWLTSDGPPEGYDLYCYPSKILASMIRALCRHAKACPADADKSLAIARRMADWLVAQSQPEGTPLAFFPPTYWGDRREVAVRNAGRNMLGYPAHAALAYFDLADSTKEEKYRAAALRIARSYVRLQGADGTWPLLVREADGVPVRTNRLVPDRYLLGMFDRAFASTGDEVFKTAAHRAFVFVRQGPCVTWNWDGQFEDVDPLPPYSNLQKGVAVDTAIRLFAEKEQTALACEIVDWCEDQFVVWSDPLHHMDWKHWKTPTALEQYEYYTPIDASMGDMIGAFAAAYQATRRPLYLAKAKALADNVTRHQRTDGTIPTYFDSRPGSDWVNCMVYVADRLEFLADRQ